MYIKYRGILFWQFFGLHSKRVGFITCFTSCVVCFYLLHALLASLISPLWASHVYVESVFFPGLCGTEVVLWSRSDQRLVAP